MILDHIYRLAAERFQEQLTAHDLAKAAGMPLNTLTRRFNGVHGVSPMRWLWHFRTVLAAELLTHEPQLPVSEVAAACGFASAAHFARRFRLVFGQSPTGFRQGSSAPAPRPHGHIRHGAVARALRIAVFTGESLNGWLSPLDPD